MSKTPLRSITPTTVHHKLKLPIVDLHTKITTYEASLDKYREISDKHAKREKYVKALEAIEGKAFKGSGLAHFKGIQEKHKKAQELYKKHSEEVVLSVSSHKQLIEEGVWFLEVYQNKSKESQLTLDQPFVRYYGIAPEHAKKLVGHIIAPGTLHPIEKQLLQEGVRSLSKHLDAEAFFSARVEDKPYAKNVVLIDIFSRKSYADSTICIIDHEGKGVPTYDCSLPKTHTVVLWKTKAGEITLIDPNDASYSSFLVGQIIEGCKIVSGQDPTAKLYSTQNKPTDFQDHVTYPMKPRDCTDIAVKIAFELEERQRSGSTIDDVKCDTMRQISNQDMLQGSLLEHVNIRALQSSDQKERTESKKTIDEFLTASLSISTPSFKSIIKIQTLDDVKKVTPLLGDLEGFSTSEGLPE